MKKLQNGISWFLAFCDCRGRTKMGIFPRSPPWSRTLTHGYWAEDGKSELCGAGVSSSFFVYGLRMSFWMMCTFPLRYAPSSMAMRGVLMSPTRTADFFSSTRSLPYRFPSTRP